jgi:tRNA(fMet)-specific endonuclease VapC
MQYLLDSNAVIALLNDRDSPLANRVRLCKPGDIGMSSIVMHELFYGAFKSKRSENNIALIDALRLEVLDFDKEDARQSGELRAALAAQRTPIGPYDTLIAGQAKARNMTLITHNTGEFERVPGLHIEDWQA